MNFIDFEKALYNRAEDLNYQERISLAIEISKRLFPFYKSFHNESGFGNPDILLDSIRFIESGGSDLDQIQKYLELLEEVAPDTDDFEDSSYALNACGAINGLLLQVAEPSEIEHFIETAMAYYDTMDAKVQESADEELSEEKIYRHPVMMQAVNFLFKD